MSGDTAHVDIAMTVPPLFAGDSCHFYSAFAMAALRNCEQYTVWRHGETQWNKMEKMQGKVEIPLNARGVELAYATKEGLKGVIFDAAF